MLRRVDPAAPLALERRRMTTEIVLRVVLMFLAIVVLPGIFTGDIQHFRGVARSISYGLLPYRDQLWEFPPLTLVTLALEPLSFGSLGLFKWIFGFGMVLCEYGSLRALRRAYPESDAAITRAWTIGVLPIALLAWFRNDFLAVYFATLAIIAGERRRPTTWPIALGAAAKLWPGVFILVAAVERRWRQVIAGTAVTVGGVLLWWAYSPDGVRAFLRFRRGSGLQIESLPASIRLLGHHSQARGVSGAWVIDAGRLGWVEQGSMVALAVFTAFVVGRAWRPGRDIVALAGSLVLAAMLFSRILSPQYLVWAAPAVVVLWARGDRLVGRLFTVSVWLTLPVLLWYGSLVDGRIAVALVLLTRNAVLIGLLIVLAVRIRPARDAAVVSVDSDDDRRGDRSYDRQSV